jgi:crotonobetainyl-CoA:carnitine CoA-transferase CaiB-like acyl-CoA transferase
MSGRVLDGVRILDLTRVVAGPFATAVLADLGAEVIKVERPRTGDDYRYGPSKPGETSLSFQNTNRGKRSLTLDLHRDEGRALLLRLVERADAVVENFRAGWLASQGLAPEVIQARNPRCVVASLSGFGQTGPLAGRASYDIVAQAAGGLLAMTGFADGPPVRGGGALADFVGGLYLALGLCAALLERERTGRARVLDLSNQDAVFAITDSAATIFAGIGARMERVGNQHPFTAPYDVFATRDGWVVVATAITSCSAGCVSDRRPELADDERTRNHRGRASTARRSMRWWSLRASAPRRRSWLPSVQGSRRPCARIAGPKSCRRCAARRARHDRATRASDTRRDRLPRQSAALLRRRVAGARAGARARRGQRRALRRDRNRRARAGASGGVGRRLRPCSLSLFVRASFPAGDAFRTG